MSAAFRTAISQLWSSLALPAPVFGDDLSIILSIESDSVLLTESEDGRCILVTSTAGHVTADPVLRTMQIRDILFANLSTLSTHRASVSIADQFGLAEPPVVVTGVYRYGGPAVDALIAVIEDVLALSQTHAAELQRRISVRSVPPATRAQSQDTDEDLALIFRP